mgnify:CR=1 FL=1
MAVDQPTPTPAQPLDEIDKLTIKIFKYINLGALIGLVLVAICMIFLFIVIAVKVL